MPTISSKHGTTRLIFTLAGTLLAGCGGGDLPPADRSGAVATIFHGGDIVTMEGNEPEVAESVVVEDGRITFVGALAQAREVAGPEAADYDLQGRTLMPGFIEPHAHPASIGALILANDIVAPHEWRMPHRTYPAVDSQEAYLEAVRRIINEKEDRTRTVMIWGYHKAWHGELTLAALDEVTGEVPTIVWQRSTHEFYLNTAAAERYGVENEGFQEQEQVDWENLHFWERAYQEAKTRWLAPFFADPEMIARGLERMSDMMLANGLVAMSEPSFPNSVFQAEYEALKAETDRSASYGLYLQPGFPEQFSLGLSTEAYVARIDSMPSFDTDHITFVADHYKTFGDGAIYSLALQLREPFVNCPECHSEWIIPPAEAQELFDAYWDRGFRIHVHITGDLAFETYLDFVEEAMARNPRPGHRTTFEHVGLFDAGQAERTAELGIEVSANPYYLWALADKYSETGMGPERASSMVALGELTRRGVPVSLHSDFAMAPAEPLLLAWVAVNRVVASGASMRPELGISVFEAMKGITLDAAGTFGMEDELGSIREGKQASFTLLADNPFEVDPMALKDIDVLGVVYKGRVIEAR